MTSVSVAAWLASNLAQAELHPAPHSPVPAEFHRPRHQYAAGPHKADAAQDGTQVSGLEAEVATKKAEIHQMRAEVNRLEADLLHEQEVLQIKEHALGVLEGRLMKEQDEASQQQGPDPHPHFVASTRS